MGETFDPDILETKVRGAAHDFRYDRQLILRFDKLSPTTSGLYAWVELRNGSLESTPFHFGRYDLMGPRTQTGLAQAGRQYADRWPWDELVTRCIYSVVQSHLEGPDPVDLLSVQPDSRPKYLIRPNVMGSGATTLAAAGGSGKSLYALACALTVATGQSRFLGVKPDIEGPVMYIDYEADAETHNERLRALCAGGDLPGRDRIIYSPQKYALRRVADSVAKHADTYGVVMIVVDSVMLARGGEANYSDSNIDFYAALREINRPALLIDHKSREAIRKGRAGAFGSIVNENSARLVWDMGGAHPLPGNDRRSVKAIKLVAGKRNNVGDVGDLAYRVEIESDNQDRMISASFTPINPKEVKAAPADTGESEGSTDAVVEFLETNKARAFTADEIADGSGTKLTSVRVILSRDDRFAQTGDKKGRSALWQMAGWKPHLALVDDDPLPDPYDPA